MGTSIALTNNNRANQQLFGDYKSRAMTGAEGDINLETPLTLSDRVRTSDWNAGPMVTELPEEDSMTPQAPTLIA